MAPPPDLCVILQLIVEKYDIGQQHHKCSYALKFKILGQKCPCMSFCLIFISHDIMSAVFVSNITSANVILSNSSVYKKFILFYILNTILSVFAQFYQQKYYL